MEQNLPNIIPPDLISAMRPTRVCSCMHLTSHDLIQAMRAGHDTFSSLQRETGCCTGCGTCENQVIRLLSDFKNKSI